MPGELKMKNHSKILLCLLLGSTCLSAFELPTIPGSDNLCSSWKEKRYKVVKSGIALLKNTLCYNASVLPLNGARKVRVKFKYQGKSTECGLFFYSHNSGYRGRELVYLPNCDQMREFNGEFEIPPVIDKKKILGIRIVFRTRNNGIVSDVSVTPI